MIRGTALARATLMAGLLACAACFGGAQFLLKSPIADRCTEAGLKGCDALTDGVLEYVDGDRAEALKKIKEGAAENAPDQLRDFADALRTLKAIPGADHYAHPVFEVADLLARPDQEPRSGSSKRTAPHAKASSKRESAEEDGGSNAVKPDQELVRSTARISVPSGDIKATPCVPFGDTNIDVADMTARCLVVAKGPMVLTDVQTTGICVNDLLIGAGDPANPRWALVSAATAAPLSIHGANFAVLDKEGLFVAQTAPTAAALRGDLHCAITWSGTVGDAVAGHR